MRRYGGLDPGFRVGAAAVVYDSGELDTVYSWRADDNRVSHHRYYLRQHYWTGEEWLEQRLHKSQTFEECMIALCERIPTLQMAAVEGMFLSHNAKQRNQGSISLLEAAGAGALVMAQASEAPPVRPKAAVWRKAMMRVNPYTKRKAAAEMEKKYAEIRWPKALKARRFAQHVYAACWLADYARLTEQRWR